MRTLLIVGQVRNCGSWGGSCTATPGRQYNCRPNENLNIIFGHFWPPLSYYC